MANAANDALLINLGAHGQGATIPSNRINEECSTGGHINARSNCKCGNYYFRFLCTHNASKHEYKCGASQGRSMRTVFCYVPTSNYNVNWPRINRNCRDCDAAAAAAAAGGGGGGGGAAGGNHAVPHHGAGRGGGGGLQNPPPLGGGGNNAGAGRGAGLAAGGGGNVASRTPLATVSNNAASKTRQTSTPSKGNKKEKEKVKAKDANSTTPMVGTTQKGGKKKTKK